MEVIRPLSLNHVSSILGVRLIRFAAVDVPLNDVLVLVAPPGCLEFTVGHFFSFSVGNLHDSNMLQIHRANDNVVHLSFGPIHDKVLISGLQSNVLEADWSGFQVTALERHLCVRVHVVCVVV